MTIATMELREISDNLSRRQIFGDYPFPAGHRKEFERKFLAHYRYREIAHPTVDMFRYRLNSYLNDIMPYYNQLYCSENIQISPLLTYKAVTSTKRKNDTETLLKALTKAVDDTLSRTHDSVITSGNSTNHTESVGNTNTDGETSRVTDGTVNVQSVTEDDTIEERAIHTTETTENDNTKQITGSKEYSENSGYTLNKKFSDTPQENFVIGDDTGPPNYIPLSTYATTLNLDTQSANKSSNESYQESQTGHDEGSTNTNTSDDKTTDRDIHATTDTTSHEEQESHSYETSYNDSTSDSETNETGKRRGELASDTRSSQTQTSSTIQSILDKLSETVTVTGNKNYSEADLLNRFRDTFLNIDLMIIEECDKLFLGIF